MIIRQATAISSNDSFKVSTSWIQGFFAKNDLSLRQRTTVCQNPLAACISKLVNFITRDMHRRDHG